MQFWSKLRIALVGMVVVLAGCGGNTRRDDATWPNWAGLTRAIPVARFDRMPAGIARNSDGLTFVAFPSWVERGPSLLRDAGDLEFRPWLDDGVAASFRSVNGLHMDSQDRLWVVDNGRVDLGPPSGPPEVVVLNSATGEVLLRRSFGASVAPLPGAFLNDVAVVEDQNLAIFTDSGIDGESALVVWDYEADVATRVLAGHPSVQADPAFPVVIGNERIMVGPKVGAIPWLVGANGIASSGDTVIFGATSSSQLWCASASDLRNPDFDSPTPCANNQGFDGIATFPSSSLNAQSTGSKQIEPAFVVVGADIQRGWLSMVDIESGSITPLPRPQMMDCRPLKPRLVGVPMAYATYWATESMSYPVAVEPFEHGILVTEGQYHLMPLLDDGNDRRAPHYWLWFVPW